ncbi:hypothetical protein TTHERM_00475170 (macronuclear) [Tetrahymena thermophila SB210]|uniref:Uncharacterized protein n=1 Tax=Tetrahymena thermophila (strain SB210) TaxID=312017 RepID=I7MA56_TETTS|nr:hypothetical protein TTHERM_00475170 [Tetrahymena thermophila SB210]EAS03754.2 hypothetical protein TTHERM_00475170 [Tetrahymena thermophila SB210]|eukprot:XP_001023999.2 hypothetical protein TTHERM_00475170 [Tetrahymena thermophila SB210]
MSFKNYYKEIIINFQTERNDDQTNLESHPQDNQQQQQKINIQSQNIQISNNSLPTKSSPLSRQKIDDQQNSPFSFSQKQHNKTYSLAKNMSQSSLSSQKNQSVNFTEVVDGLGKQNIGSQSQKNLNILQNNSNDFVQNNKSIQKNDKAQQGQQNIYQFQFQQKLERVREDFDLNNQEYKKELVEVNKKKPSPIKLSPTSKPHINAQQYKQVSDFNQNTQNGNNKHQKNNSYFQQFETFSAKNESQELSNKSSNLLENSQDNVREQRLINLQKKYIENYDNENNQINSDKFTVDSSISSNLRLSDQNIQGKYTFQKNVQNQLESPQKFQDSSIDTARNTIKTKSITNNLQFKDPINNVHEKSTCRNNYKNNKEDFIQFNTDFSHHLDQNRKTSSVNKKQIEQNSDQQSNQGQICSDDQSYIKIQYDNQNFQDKYAEKENKNQLFKSKSLSKKENQIEEQLDQKNRQQEALKAFESQRQSDLQIFINENLLLQQELNFSRQNLKETIEHYERQTDYYKDEIERLKQHLKIQELNQQDLNIQNELRNQELLLHQQLEVEAHKQGKNEQLLQIIKKIQQIDVRTESIFSHKLEQERREKEEIIEKNMILQQQIQDLQNSLDYCRDYFRTSQDAQMKEKLELNQSIRIELEAKNQQIIEERRQHKQQLNLINEEIKRQTEEHQKYIEQTEQQIANIENFYKKQLDDFKRTYEISIQKTKCITDEFDRLVQESNKNKELLQNCQRQLKSCEIRNSQLAEKNIQFNNKIVEINNILMEKEQEKDAMLKEINQQAFSLDEKEKLIDKLQQEEEDYKKLQFSFKVEAKRLQEQQEQLDNLISTCSNQLEEIEQLKINLDQKSQENKVIKEEFEAFLEKNSKVNDLSIEHQKQKQNLEQQIIQLRLTNEGLSAKNQLLEQQTQKLTLTSQNLQLQLEQKEELLNKLTRKEEKNNRKYQENIMVLKSDIEQLQISDKQKSEENAKLKLKVKKIENESFLQLEEFKNQLESYYNNLIIKYQGDNNSETQKEQLQNEILSLKKKICNLESDYSLSILENQRLQRDLQEKNDEIEILFNRLKEIEILKSQLSLQLQEVEMQRKNDIESSQKIYE